MAKRKSPAKEQPERKASGLRMKKELSDWVNDLIHSPLGQRLDLSRDRVVEAAVLHIRGMKEADREIVLRGLDKNPPIPILDDILGQLSWSEHAFRSKRLSWALQEFQHLEAHALSRSMDPLTNFARFKQSHCWLDIATLLRGKALRESGTDQAEHFNAAFDAIGQSIARSELLKVTSHGIIFYNLGCCYSLLAQFRVERAMALEGLARDLIEILVARRKGEISQDKADDDVAEWWIKKGVKWRDRWKTGSPLADQVQQDGSNAMKSLGELIRSTSNASDSIASPNTRTAEEKQLRPQFMGFVFEAAAEDGDLLFMRTDRELSEEFKIWQRKGADQNDSSLLKAWQILSRPTAKPFDGPGDSTGSLVMQ